MARPDNSLIESTRALESYSFQKNLQALFSRAKNLLKIPQPKEKDIRRILGFIEDNDKMSKMLVADEYLALLDKEKALKGSCKIGVVVCIDGRISILHQFGRTVNSWELAGSLVEAETRADGKIYLTSQRLINTLIDAVDSPEGRDLLEIVTFHTSADPEHKCGKITGMLKDKGIPSDQIDDTAMKAAELRRQAIENTYNEILIDRNKQPQEQVAITAMIDTDTMGFILNYQQENQLSTTDLIKGGLSAKIDSQIPEMGGFGSMKDTFTNFNSYKTYLEKVIGITDYLMNNETNDKNSVMNGVKQYISEYYPKLTENQRQSLLFTIARTIANQYVTGLAGEEAFEHAFSKHHEDYIVISPFGKPMARFDISRETFGSTPNDRADALKHVKTKLSIMDSHEKEGYEKEPRIVFISNPVKGKVLEEIQGSPTFAEIADSNRKYYEYLLMDEELGPKIIDGEIILVPLLVDDDTGEVLQIMENNPIYVKRGTPLPEMPE